MNSNSKPPYAVVCNCCGNFVSFVFEHPIPTNQYCRDCATDIVRLNVEYFKATRFNFANIGEANFNFKINITNDGAVNSFLLGSEFKEKLHILDVNFNEIKTPKQLDK